VAGETKPTDRKSFGTCARGFTIIEVVVAVTLLVIVVLINGGHSRVYNQLLAGVQADKRVAGHVDLLAERAFLMISETGPAAGPPPCDVQLKSINWRGSFPRAFVRVEQVVP